MGEFDFLVREKKDKGHTTYLNSYLFIFLCKMKNYYLMYALCIYWVNIFQNYKN